MGRWKKIMLLCIITIPSIQFSLFAQQKNDSPKLNSSSKQTKQLLFLTVLALLAHKVTAPEITWLPIEHRNTSRVNGHVQIAPAVAETFSALRCENASLFFPSPCHGAALNALLILYITLGATLIANCIGGT